ncbi:hypothetical protein Hbl1158_00160 [Halobaculum sp. CBA1158]|uniref:DUF7472 family protein n=1 Tax=Halobaculum sp. CBA1158 TaxID=2904243 RepID=UPI001F3FF7DD|nr:hypothetical protein [Halobaculum sp. CBA1158]UIO99829.1 hypothetical protein Hbl1158_00160 [Halobaculum sp. CBA1158]
MELDAEMRRKIAVSTGAVVVFIALLIAIGTRFSTGHNLSVPGAYYIVGIIALFVLLMAGAGVYLDD